MAVKIVGWLLLSRNQTIGFFQPGLTAMKNIFLLLLTCLLLSSCAKVGSNRWCKNMEDKSKSDWTANETGDYTKYCLMGMDPDKE